MTAEWDGYRRMTVQHWLADVRRCAAALPGIKSSIEHQSEYADMLGSVRYDRIGGHASPVNGDDAVVAHITRMHRDLAHLLSVLADKSEVVTQAEMVFADLSCHPCACAVMRMRWIDGDRWERIADGVGYDERHIRRIADDAELECFDIMPQAYRDRIPNAEN